MLPKHLTRRFISADQDAVVVSGGSGCRCKPTAPRCRRTGQIACQGPHRKSRLQHFGNRSSSDCCAQQRQHDRKIEPGVDVRVRVRRGFHRRRVPFIGRDVRGDLAGNFPVVASGALLSATGQGLQFASVVALIVSFGLGLSATIHFLNRLLLEDRPGQDPGIAVERATVLVGPALILTSVVLACGLAVNVFSDLPSLRLFGWMSAFAIARTVCAQATLSPMTF